MQNFKELTRRFFIAVNKSDGLYHLWAKDIGIKHNALSLLYALNDSPPLSQKQICEEWLIPKTTINTIVQEYLGLGYIEFDPTCTTKEKKLLLTPSGKKYTDELFEKIYKMEQEAMQKTVEKYSSTLVDAIEDFAQNFQECYAKYK